MKHKIINIINFVRGVEPRDPKIDLLGTLANQIQVLKKHNLPATYLIQYDAMIQQDYVELLKNQLDEGDEIGIWVEMVQPLTEKAGIPWRGRPGYSWDWYSNVGLTVGYLPEEREKLVDIFMEDFKAIFGKYPKSAGAWIIDAHTLSYMSEKYDITASCNCKDQWGTDGYTLWGGYYNQAYYPSRYNVLSPAQNPESQIPVPVFRMLGSDPIYQYDEGLLNDENLIPSSCQQVITLEPIYSNGGGSPEWVRWFFNEIYNEDCLSFGYTQAGQENSFGWPAMREGFIDQMKFIAEKAGKGELLVQTLAESGEWYKSSYSVTPASNIFALSDWQNAGHKTAWYYSRFYRVNFLVEGNQFWIRDLHLFNEGYKERYLNVKCEEVSCVYDNLPVMDGNRWSGGKVRAGIYPVEITPDGLTTTLKVTKVDFGIIGDEEIMITCTIEEGGEFKVYCTPDKMSISSFNMNKKTNWGMQLVRYENASTSIVSVNRDTLFLRHNGFDYSIKIINGMLDNSVKDNSLVIIPEEETLVLDLKITTD